MSDHPFAPPETQEPPCSLQRVLVTGGIGVVFTITAFVLGIASGAPSRTFDPHWMDGPRVILAAIGVVLAGSAVSMRPRDWLSWLPLGVAGLLCYGVGTQPPEEIKWMVLKPIRTWYGAVPNSWDSVQLLGGVIGVVAFIAAGFTKLPIRAVLVLTFALMAFYVSGVITSILSPPATPVLVEEYWRQFSRYHSQFLYINNAYHFYSPEPGPPSELWICLKYEPLEGEPSKPDEIENDPDTEWVSLPRRNRDSMDPLRLSFYRRIALIDVVAQIQLNYTPLFPEELQKTNTRRLADLGRIPKGSIPDNAQFLPPQDFVIRNTLPSYAMHFAKRYGRPGRKVASVKIYRALHEVLTMERFRTMNMPTMNLTNPGAFKWHEDHPVVGKPYRLSPYYPTLYNPYFQGEFDTNGKLMNPTDPELYWMIPILDLKTYEPNDKPVMKSEYDRYFTDYVSVHAGSKRPKE
ncbi:magnesium transporter [Zavarzinella formosa]|uniref:magnesium transporter n=1 Tax=Zavarzinella formosa TaxID=360055 RepID=UPI00030FF024|nr:magnesium transporter [Zavarzinella formosa]